MVDRSARDEMAKAIRSYMNEEITAFQFDDVLDRPMDATTDGTVQATRLALWFYYDDCTDHRIVASKGEWDYFNRLLVLLASDGEIETVKRWWQWHLGQALAASLVLIFVFIGVRVGFGTHLIAYALPFGPASMLLAWLNSRRRRRTVSALQAALAPFPSVSSLLSVRRTLTGFAKVRYPSAILGRRIRDPITDRLLWVPWAVLWCVFSPVALCFQMLPERESETRIRMPKSPDAGNA